MTVPGKLKLVKDTVPDIIRTNLTLNLDPTDTASSSGSVYYDLTGTDNADIVNSPTHNTAGYYDFDGVNQHLSRATPVLTGTNSFTFEIWFNLDSVSGNFGSNNAAFFFTGASTNTAELFIYSSAGASNQPEELRLNRFGSGSGTSFNISADIALSEWRQVVVTHNGSTGAQAFYINGTLKHTATFVYTWPIPAATKFMGNTSSSSYSGYLNGKVGEIRSYSSVLTAAEVTNNWNARRGRYGL